MRRARRSGDLRLTLLGYITLNIVILAWWCVASHFVQHLPA
ncbi:hypothetical protein T09_1778 [Trichinella sp. T9]|nr:hypothetical protein T09_1778 [Trichinella sp. T9]